MDKSLIEAGIAKGDYQSIKLRLRELGFNALVIKGAHTPINFRCRHRHQWTATPMEAINEGCPTCNLVDHIANDPAPVVSWDEWKKGVDKQHKFLKDVLKTTKRRLINAKSRAVSGKYGI